MASRMEKENIPASSKPAAAAASSRANIGGNDDITEVITGDELADLVLLNRGGPRGANVSAPGISVSVTAALRQAREVECRHEIVALVQGGTRGNQLIVNWQNLNRLQADGGEEERERPTLVVSFLGDTEAGKSHSIRALMSDEEERPYVQRSSDQRASTTSNVNLYRCNSLCEGSTVLLLDYEGEYGSQAPLLARPTGSATGATASGGAGGAVASTAAASSPSPLVASGASAPASLGLSLGMSSSMYATGWMPGSKAGTSRAEAVKELFPKLAYTTSDVIVLVGTEPFFSTRYLQRVVELARRANNNTTGVDLPCLILVSNKRDVDRTVLDIKASTEQFMSSMGESFQQLDQLFSALVCVYLPNRRAIVQEDGTTLDGEVAFNAQIGKLRKLLGALMRARSVSRYSSGGTDGAQSRLITHRQSLWFELLPRVIRDVNAGRSVAVSRLVDEAWTATIAKASGDSDGPNDVFLAFLAFLRSSLMVAPPGSTLPDREILHRYQTVRALMMAIAVRIMAVRLRAVSAAWRLESRVTAYLHSQIDAVNMLLDEVCPCQAVYEPGPSLPATEMGTPTEQAGEPLLCLQEARVHSKGHRGARRVRGGGRTMWQKFVALIPYNPVWAGKHEPAPVSKANKDVLAAQVMSLVACSEQDFVARLSDIMEVGGVQTAAVSVGFAQLVSGAGALAPAAATSGAEAATASAHATLPADLLPYCICCGCKVQVDDGHTTEAASVGTSAPTQDGSWLAKQVGRVLEVVGLASGAADVPAAAPAAEHATRRAVAASTSAVDGAVKLSLGLCERCVSS